MDEYQAVLTVEEGNSDGLETGPLLGHTRCTFFGVRGKQEVCSQTLYDMVDKGVKLGLQRYMTEVNPPHANLVHVLDLHFDRAKDEYTVYMSWCPGGTLSLANKRFNDQEQRHILMGACIGLEYLNQTLELLHYDIKPGNIFVNFAQGGIRRVLRQGWESNFRFLCLTNFDRNC